jgi:hypothetical protein
MISFSQEVDAVMSDGVLVGKLVSLPAHLGFGKRAI